MVKLSIISYFFTMQARGVYAMEIRFYRKIANTISDRIIANGNYDEETASNIRYGMVCTLSDLYKLILFVVIFSIGGFFEEFILASLPILLRPFLGGFHAKTEIRCLILSIINLVVAISLGSYLTINIFIKIAFLVILPIIAIPISHSNTKTTNGKNMGFSILASLLTIILLVLSIWLNAGNIVFLSVIMVYFYALLKILKNKGQKEKII